MSDFTCSNRWLIKFKEHHRIVCKMICEEEFAIDENSIQFFFLENLLDVKKNYAPHTIFNADEMILCLKAQPS